MSIKLPENSLVKRPNQIQSFTKEEIGDLVACQDPIDGPHYFLNNFFYIQHPTKGRIKYQAYDFQTELLNSYHRNRFSVNMLGRQLGKCVKGDTTTVKIRNKHTGEIREISVQEFYEMQKNSRRK
jgi:hypothetical protein